MHVFYYILNLTGLLIVISLDQIDYEPCNQ